MWKQILFTGLWVFSSVGYAEADRIVIGAVGDSITQAANSTSLGNKPRLSWSTGDSSNGQVNSHYHRLQNDLGFEVEAHNASVSGAVAEDIADQVEDLRDATPDYVTFLIGANDLCAWPKDHAQDLEQFTSDIRSSLQSLVEINPEMTILLTPIPDMYNLYEVGKQKSCTWMWRLFNICPPLLGNRRTQQERMEFVSRWQDANQALFEVSKEFSNNVVYVEQLQFQRFEEEHVSGVDCFHPSDEGQNLLAELTWMESLFAR